MTKDSSHQAREVETVFNEAVRFIERDYGGAYAERDYPILLLAYIVARALSQPPKAAAKTRQLTPS